MSDLTPLFAVTAFLAAALAMICIWSPRRLPLKAGALALAFALMGTAYGAMLDLLSRYFQRGTNACQRRPKGRDDTLGCGMTASVASRGSV